MHAFVRACASLAVVFPALAVIKKKLLPETRIRYAEAEKVCAFLTVSGPRKCHSADHQIIPRAFAPCSFG